MRCASCQAVYSNALEACPRCQTPTGATPVHAAVPAPPADAAADAPARRSPLAAGGFDPAPAQARLSGTTTRNTASTLIEFPGAARPAQPAWRKELSDRVREIQERRAREVAAGDAAVAAPRPHSDGSTPSGPLQLGLVPPPPADEERHVNPIVAAALARIERARQSAPPPQPAPIPSPAAAASSTFSGAQPAKAFDPPSASIIQPLSDAASETHPVSNDGVPTQRGDARGADAAAPNDDVRPATLPAPAATTDAAARHGIDVNSPAFLKHKQEEAARTRAKLLDARQLAAKQFAAPPAREVAAARADLRGTDAAPATRLAAVEPAPAAPQSEQTPAPARTEPAHAERTPAPAREHVAARRVAAEVIDESALARREAEEAARERKTGDLASIGSRAAAGVIDLVAVGFFASPVPALFEFIYDDLSGAGVRFAVCSAALLILFAYLTIAVALAGRTWGMALLGLRVVDVETGMIPTAGQAARRGAAFVGSLLLLGLGFLYALIDPERRGAHDHFSGTIVVRE